MKHGNAARVGLLVASISLAVGVFLFLFELKEVETDLGFQGEAAVNSQLALERLLTEMGLPTRSVRGIEELPPLDHVLIMALKGRRLLELQVDEIENWVRAGGHLVVAPSWRLSQEEEVAHDLLLARFGFEARFAEHVPVESPEELTEALPDDDEPPGLDELEEDLASAVGQLFVDRRFELEAVDVFPINGLVVAEDSLQIMLPPRAHLVDEGPDDVLGAAVTDENNVVEIRSVGRGRLSVVAHDGFMDSENLAEHDNALLAWAVISGGSPRGGAWLVFRGSRPAAWGHLFERAWPVVLVAAVLFLAWVAVASRRFGPRLPPLRDELRALTEHVLASGDYLWRRGRFSRLLSHTRAAAWLSLGVAEPQFLSKERRAQLVSQAAHRAGRSKSETRQLLLGDLPSDRRQFQATVRALEDIRRAQ